MLRETVWEMVQWIRRVPSLATGQHWLGSCLDEIDTVSVMELSWSCFSGSFFFQFKSEFKIDVLKEQTKLTWLTNKKNNNKVTNEWWKSHNRPTHYDSSSFSICYIDFLHQLNYLRYSVVLFYSRGEYRIELHLRCWPLAIFLQFFDIPILSILSRQKPTILYNFITWWATIRFVKFTSNKAFFSIGSLSVPMDVECS